MKKLKTYLIINEFKDRIEISAKVNDQQLEEKKINASVEQIVKLIRKNKRAKKEVIIDTDLDLEKDEREDNKRLTLIAALNACKIKDKNKRLKYVYMSACKYLDNEYLSKNICEFCNDICMEKRKYIGKTKGNQNILRDGCCHEYKLRNLFDSSKEVPRCKYQKDGICTTANLGCKLFACDEVRKKGHNFTYYNVALVRYFFNLGQKIVIRCSIFAHKDKILKRLRILNF